MHQTFSRAPLLYLPSVAPCSTAKMRLRHSPFIAGTFYRGGTSRGLLLRERGLVPYSAANRDRIICNAMGSPDPDGRQINGLGGGVSSLSKVAIVSMAGSKLTSYARHMTRPFPGLGWLDYEGRVVPYADVVYRFGQVAIREESIDWGSTCGNMAAAVAHFAIEEAIVPYKNLLFQLPRPETVPQDCDTQYTFQVRVMAHDSGKVINARVPVTVLRNLAVSFPRWVPTLLGDSEIAGVPGTAPGIIIESPLEGSVLPTGNERDAIELDGQRIEVSIVDTGLPVVFVSASSLGIPLSSLLEHPQAIDANTELKAKLERVRQAACTLTPELQAKLSPPAPKICVVHPRCKYTTTGGEMLSADSMDVMVRAVSTGQLHRTIPATTLSALAASVSFANSVVSEQVANPPCARTAAAIQEAGGSSSIRAITVGQPAGCSTASVQTLYGQPTSTLMLRTAKRIMGGLIDVPPSIQPEPDDMSLQPESKLRSPSTRRS